MRSLGVLVVTAVLAWAIAAGSGVTVGWYAPTRAELRLSWSARPERIERCRRLSDEELAERPAHMRQRLECEGRSATYLLTVTIDGQRVDSAVVTGGGLRQDRPLFLLRSYEVAPGARLVRVTFDRREAVDSTADPSVPDPVMRGDDQPGPGASGDTGDAREARDALQRRGRRLAALPPRLQAERAVEFRGGEAVLLTIEQGAFVFHVP